MLYSNMPVNCKNVIPMHLDPPPPPKKQELEGAATVEDIGRRLGGGAVDKSLKAYYREFHKVVETSDVVLEVLDARDPLGCRCYQVEQAVMAAGTDKKLILVLNKIGGLRERERKEK